MVVVKCPSCRCYFFSNKNMILKYEESLCNDCKRGYEANYEAFCRIEDRSFSYD